MKRPRLRTTIRSLLIATTVLASWFALMHSDFRKWAGRQADVSAVSSLGGVHKTEVVGDPLLRQVIDDETQFQQVTHIWLGPGIDGYQKNKIADDEEIRRVLTSIRDPSHLESLDLRETGFTDTSISTLTRFSLDRLNLGGTRVSDDGLATLAQMDSLHDLFLDNTQVTDVGLRNLSDLQQLEELRLRNTAVTDDGLRALGMLPNLRELDVSGTDVTVSGLGSFAENHPDCEVAADFPLTSNDE